MADKHAPEAAAITSTGAFCYAPSTTAVEADTPTRGVAGAKELTLVRDLQLRRRAIMSFEQVTYFEMAPAAPKRNRRTQAAALMEKKFFDRDKQVLEELPRNGPERPARDDAFLAQQATASYPVGFSAPMLPDGCVEHNDTAAALESPMVVDTSPRTHTCYTEARQREAGSEYAQDIYNYMRRREERLTPRGNYVRTHAQITSGARSVLMNWLVKAAADFQLNGETLSLAVSNVDRFLSTVIIRRSKLQLLGIASLLIAAKFEEVLPPEVPDLVAIAAGAYSKKELVRMERQMLKHLYFDVAVPTTYYFLQRFAEVSRAADVAVYLGQYLCELTFTEDDPYLQYLPSVVAGAALCLANYTLDLHPWGQDLITYSGYHVPDLRDCIYALHKSFCSAPGCVHQAVREKFKSLAYHGVANVKPTSTLPF